jgi:DNA-binding NarL/FixJ family response regulator
MTRAKVFVVDDHPLVRQGLAALIAQQQDLRLCGEAEDADHALQRICAVKPDVAVVDIALKGTSGITLIQNLRARCPEVGIVVLSMHEDGTAVAERARKAGAAAFVTKSASPARLIEAIHDVLKGDVEGAPPAAATRKLRSVRGMIPYQVTEHLTNREFEVFCLLGQGLETRAIADKLRLSMKTIHVYYERMRRKLNLPNSTQLQLEAVRCHEGLAWERRVRH